MAITSTTAALVGTGVLGAATSMDASSAAQDAAQASATSTAATAAGAEALNIERFDEARDLMGPSIGRADIASQQLMSELGLPQTAAPGQDFAPSSAYMDQLEMVRPESAGLADSMPIDYQNLPGYQDLMAETLGAVEQTAASSGSTAYGGRRLSEAGKVGGAIQQSFYENEMGRRMQEGLTLGSRQDAFDINKERMKQSYYNNYMNMLQNLSSPGSATNLASLGVGQAANIGAQNIASTAASNEALMQGTVAQNTAAADTMGGFTNLMSGAVQGGYFDQPPATNYDATGTMPGFMLT